MIKFAAIGDKVLDQYIIGADPNLSLNEADPALVLFHNLGGSARYFVRYKRLSTPGLMSTVRQFKDFLIAGVLPNNTPFDSCSPFYDVRQTDTMSCKYFAASLAMLGEFLFRMMLADNKQHRVQLEGPVFH